MYISIILFFSETAWPIKVNVYRKHLKEWGTNLFINIFGYMTKMATIPIQGKNTSNIFYSGTAESIAMKHDMKQLVLEYYNVFINHDPMMTLKNFKARSI